MGQILDRKRVMHGLAVGQQDDTQIPPFHVWDRRPTPKPSIRLNDLFHRIIHRPLYPFLLDYGAVGTGLHRLEVPGKTSSVSLNHEGAERNIRLIATGTPPRRDAWHPKILALDAAQADMGSKTLALKCEEDADQFLFRRRGAHVLTLTPTFSRRKREKKSMNFARRLGVSRGASQVLYPGHKPECFSCRIPAFAGTALLSEFPGLGVAAVG
ncbi:MAG: hypothetical protein ACRESR_08485 [Gammaproteobacteria bacterium]